MSDTSARFRTAVVVMRSGVAGLLVVLGSGCWVDFGELLARCDAGEGVCARDGGQAGDAGADDAGLPDAGPNDAGEQDAGPPADAGTPDAGAEDAGAEDAGAPDSGVPDAGEPDDGGAGPCPGFTFGRFCWVNPTPQGDDLTALLYESERDIWVGGRAGTMMHGVEVDGGFAWTDLKLTGQLRASGFSAEVTGLVRLDAGVLAVGAFMKPHFGTSLGLTVWGPWLDTQVFGTFNAWGAAGQPDGTFMAVGTNEDDSSVFMSGRHDVAEPAVWTGHSVMSAVGAIPDGGYLRAFTDLGGVHIVLRPDYSTSTVMITPSADTSAHTRALWFQPTGESWYAGDACRVGVAATTQGPWSAYQPCDAAALVRFHAGAWSQATNRSFIAGTNGAILEATAADLVLTPPLRQRFDSVVPAGAPTFHAIAALPDGGGLAVGDGAFVVRRMGAQGTGPDPMLNWMAQDPHFRAHVNDLVRLPDGGLWVLGGDRVVAAPDLSGGPAAASRPRIVFPGVAGSPYLAAWAGGGTVYVAEEHGSLATLDDQGRRHDLWADAGVNAGWVLDLHGTRPNDITAVGVDGLMIHGGPTQFTLLPRRTQPDGGQVDFRGVTSSGGTTWVVAASEWSRPPWGALVRMVDGGTPVLAREVSQRLSDVDATASGTVWVAGENSTAARYLPLDGGWREWDVSQACGVTPCRNTDFTGVLALSDEEAWAVGGDGVLYHYLSGTWTLVETGTRRTLKRLAMTDDGAGHRYLWLVGDFGTVLRMKL